MYSFQVEICTGAVFMRLVLGLDVYLATVVLLSVAGICSVTGEVTLTPQALVLTRRLCLLVGTRRLEIGPAFALSLRL